MKRLFIIRRGKRGEPVQGLTFPSKQEAKKVRDSLGADYVVSYGPDHRKFKGV